MLSSTMEKEIMKWVSLILLFCQTSYGFGSLFFQDPKIKSLDAPIQINKNLSKIETNEFDKKKFWEHPSLELSYGSAYTFYENKNNRFIEEEQSYFSVDFSKNFYKHFSFGLKSFVNLNILLLKEYTNIYFYNSERFKISLILEFGQKINFKNDIDSGYIFYSYGIKSSYNFQNLTLNYSHLINFNQLKTSSHFFSILYRYRQDMSIGLEISEENIDSLKKEYSKEGLLIRRIGLLHSFLF